MRCFPVFLAQAAATWKIIAILIAVIVVLLLAVTHLGVILGRGPRLRGQHVTKQGAIFFLATLAIGVVALNTKVNFLVLIFGMMLSAAVLSIGLSRLAMRRLRFERIVPPGVHPGEPFTVELRATNAKRWVSSYGVVIRDDLPEGIAAERPGGVLVQLRAGETAPVFYTAVGLRRGVYPLSAVTVSTRFPFGFFHQERQRPLAGELVVYPRLGAVAASLLGRAQALTQTRHQTHSAPGQEEFRNLREYRPGDNPRWIHWKSSAKLGQPLVKEYESIASERALLLLDTRCRASGEEPLESAISFAATLARDLMRRDFSVALAAYAPDLVVTAPLKGPAGLHALLGVLARLEPNRRRGFSELIAEEGVRAEGRLLTVAVLLRTDDDAASALDALQSRQPRLLALDASSPSFREVFQLPARPSDDSTRHEWAGSP